MPARLQPAVVVIGGANLDVKARAIHDLGSATSNPGYVTTGPGGVGRNIAEVVARLGTSCALVTAIGDDHAGRVLRTSTEAAGVNVASMRTGPLPTGTYVAVLDPEGELVTAVSDMSAVDGMTAEDVAAAEQVIRGAELVALDGNLPADVLVEAGRLATASGARVVLDPVSTPKAARLRALLLGLGADRLRVDVLTPTTDELSVGLGCTAADLLRAGVGAVWERRGAAGSTLHLATRVIDLPASPVAEVVDVTGAGDAMVGGLLHGLATGADLESACRRGHDVAAKVVASPHTVPTDLA